MALYENTIRLKGFVGKNAQSKSAANGNPIVIFTLATKSRYKDKQSGEWSSRTEWHRIICFGPAARSAQELQKGNYIEVEGELHSSKYDAAPEQQQPTPSSKRRSWEVRARHVRKLERPDNVSSKPAAPSTTV